MTKRIAIMIATALSGCALSPVPLATSEAKRVKTLNGTADHVIECKYEMRNCEREARKVCGGRYLEVSRGDRTCTDCGLSLNDSNTAPVWRGTMYVACQ